MYIQRLSFRSQDVDERRLVNLEFERWQQTGEAKACQMIRQAIG